MIRSESSRNTRVDRAALTVLVILQGLMLGALYTRTPPHPPLDIPLFALGPFLSAAIALGVAALVMDGIETGAGRGVTLLATVAALVSFGPQKWFVESFGAIWPAVVVAQIACTVLVVSTVGPILHGRSATADTEAA